MNLTDDVFSITFDRRGGELVIVYRNTAVDRVDLNASEVRLEHLAPAISGDRSVIAAAVSPDGERLLMASQTSAYSTIEPQWLSAFDRGAARWRPPIVAPKRTSFILGRDATTFATLSSDGLLSFASSSGGRASVKLGQTTLVGLNADGSRLFAVRPETDALTLLMVSLPQGTTWSGTLPSSAAALDGQFSGDRLALRQVDSVSVWDLAQPRLAFEVPGAVQFAWLHDAERLLTWSAESVDVRDARSGRWIERLSGHDHEVTGVGSGGPSGLPVTIAGQELYFWNRPQVDRVLATATGAPMTVSFSAAGDTVITASGRSVQVYDAHSGSPTSSIAAPAPITALALAPDDKHIAIGTAQGEILLHSLQDTSGSPVKPSGGGPITAVAFGASERLLAWAAQSGTHTTAVVLRDLRTNEDVVSQQIPGDVIAMAIDGNRVAVGLDEPPTYRGHITMSLGEVVGSTVVQLIDPSVRQAVVAPASSAQPGKLPPPGRPPAQTDTPPPPLLPTPPPPPPPLLPTPPPPPSQRLLPPPVLTSPPSGAVPTAECYKGRASLSSNLGFAATVISCLQTVMEWRDLLPVVPLKTERPVARIAVSPDGNYFALAYIDGGITLHHTSLPSRSALLAGPGDDITALAFDKHAARLAAARADGSVSIFPIGGPELRKAAEQLVGTQNPTPDECLRLFGASNQCEEIGEWRLMTQRIFRALTGR